METTWLIHGVETGLLGSLPLMAFTIVLSAVTRLLR